MVDESKQSGLQSSSEPSEIMNINEGINSSEGYNLVIYINQYRKEAGVPELTWNTDLEFEAQNLATSFATGSSNDSFIIGYSIGRQCNGAKMQARQYRIGLMGMLMFHQNQTFF